MSSRFHTILNYGALAILLLSIGLLLSSLYHLIFATYDEPTHINFTLDSVHVDPFDSAIIIANKSFVEDLNKRTDSLKIQIDELKKIRDDLEQEEKKNEDYYKLILAVVGSVFAIVGFFGFKSINDTRQATLDAAKNNATEIAKTIAGNKAKEVAAAALDEYIKKEGEVILREFASKEAKIVAFDKASEVAKNTSKEEVNKYLLSLEEFQKALKQDIQDLERKFNVLRSRVLELEIRSYGAQPDESGEGPTNTPPPAPQIDEPLV